MQLVADSSRILRRYRQEETSFVRQSLQAAGFCFLHEDIAAMLDELVEIVALLLKLRERRLILLDARE